MRRKSPNRSTRNVTRSFHGKWGSITIGLLILCTSTPYRCLTRPLLDSSLMIWTIAGFCHWWQVRSSLSLTDRELCLLMINLSDRHFLHIHVYHEEIPQWYVSGTRLFSLFNSNSFISLQLLVTFHQLQQFFRLSLLLTPCGPRSVERWTVFFANDQYSWLILIIARKN